MFGAVSCMWDDVLNVELIQRQMKSLVKTYICNVIKTIIINIKHCKLVSYSQKGKPFKFIGLKTIWLKTKALMVRYSLWPFRVFMYVCIKTSFVMEDWFEINKHDWIINETLSI